MVKTYESSFPPSPNSDKISVSFDTLNNTDLFLQSHGSLVDKTDLLALYLSGTYRHRTGTRTPSCKAPRQLTIYTE